MKQGFDIMKEPFELMNVILDYIKNFTRFL